MGFWTNEKGQKIEFTDTDTLRDVADLLAIANEDYHGSESAISAVLKGMLGDIQDGRPLSADQWTLLQRFRARYKSQLNHFHDSPDNELEGFVPVPLAGSGRITEAMRTLPPSVRRRIHENYKTTTNNNLDKQITSPHLHDTTMHDIAHALQHAQRLTDPSVLQSKDSVAFNVEHLLNHLKSAQDHGSRLGVHIADNGANAKVWTSEKTVLRSLKEDGGKRGSTVCVDFDGVIHQGPHGMPGKVEGNMVPGTDDALAKLKQMGHKVVVLTARADFGAVRNWLDDQGLSQYIDDVTNVKPSAQAYIDDRAVHFSNWEDALQAVDPSDETPLDGQGAVIKERGARIPPNLRTQVNPDAVNRCSSCEMDDNGLCWGYGNYPIKPDWVCDSWEQDPSEPDNMDLVKLAQQNPAALANLNIRAFSTG